MSFPREHASTAVMAIQVGLAILCHAASVSSDGSARKMSGGFVSLTKLLWTILSARDRSTLSNNGATTGQLLSSSILLSTWILIEGRFR